ncbi:MAG: 4Fe-4S binding protein [Desulfotomaculales bacterium]
MHYRKHRHWGERHWWWGGRGLCRGHAASPARGCGRRPAYPPPPWPMWPPHSIATHPAPPARTGQPVAERKGVLAWVNPAACSGCGSCASACPVGAIVLGPVASADPRVCRGCGACAERCPTGAIALVSLPSE